MDHEKYLGHAYDMARRSSDLSTQNGAVLYCPRTNRRIATGFNDNHLLKPVDPALLERPLKYQWTEHAERAAIYEACASGHCTTGLWMYCCWAACTDCARGIALSGITKLIRHHIPQHVNRPDWNASITVADQILKAHGVEIVVVTGPLGYKIRFDGKDILV